MNAPQTTMYLCAFVLFIATCTASVHNEHSTQIDRDNRKLEIFDGVHLEFPAENNTGRLLSIEVNTNRSLSEGRRKTKTKKLMQKFLPIFILPFVLQSAITPFILGLLKFLLIKAILVGKLALTLIIFNAFRNHNSYKGRDTNSYYDH